MPPHQPPRILLIGSILLDACTTRKDPGLERWARDNTEMNPTTIKSKTVSHVAEQSSWVPSPFCSPHGYLFPIKLENIPHSNEDPAEPKTNERIKSF